MGKVIIDMSMSLDGFIAGMNDSQENPLGEGGGILHDWLFNGEEDSNYNAIFKLSPERKFVFDESFDATGAIVTGRRTFDIVGG